LFRRVINSGIVGSGTGGTERWRVDARPWITRERSRDRDYARPPDFFIRIALGAGLGAAAGAVEQDVRRQELGLTHGGRVV